MLSRGQYRHPRPRGPVTQAGETLVSLMVGLTVGLGVLVGAGSMFFSDARAMHFALNESRLDQELQTVMALMAADIRRAGYSSTGFACALNSSCGNAFTTGVAAFAVSTNQITYAYDAADNGNLSAAVTYPVSPTSPVAASCSGFRFNQTGSFGAIDRVTSCAASVGANPGWTALTDPRAINITNLAFSVATYCSAAHVQVRDVKVYLSASAGGVNRSLCRRVHVDNDSYVTACTAGTATGFSTAAPFDSAQCAS